MVLSIVTVPTVTVAPAVAMATPAIGVSVAAADALLGGDVVYDVTVTNPGDTKAYNVTIGGAFGSIPATSGASLAYGSASDGLTPTSYVVNSVTGTSTVSFANIRDLAPGESYTLHLVMKLGATKWSVGDTVTSAFTASALDAPAAVPGANAVSGSGSKNVKVIPIVALSKAAAQSTGVEQATGTQTRTYSYTITVQNNYVNPTTSVVVTDTIDDGIAYQGMTAGPDPFSVTRSATTGKTVVVWHLGTMAAGQETKLTYKTGIRYDYYGTANGGKNTSDTASIPTTDTTPIPNKLRLDNNAGLAGLYTDPVTSITVPASSGASASVTAAYFTGEKSQVVHGNGGPGSTVDYTLTGFTSQYYSIAASASITVTDTLPDGLSYVAGSAPIAPDSVTHKADGTTDIVWVRPPLAASSQAKLTFTAVVDDTYEGAPLAGQPIVSGDSFTNNVGYSTVWDDLVNPTRANSGVLITTSAASAGFPVPKPSILKQVWDPKTASWAKETTATVGDVLHFRVCFNTNGDKTPILTDTPMGKVDLTDWLPMGTSLVPGSVVTTFSTGAFTSLVKAPNPSDPTTLSAAGITGMEWWLDNVAKGGWWQGEFDVVVDADPAVSGGVRTANMWKFTGTNSYGTNYSLRDSTPLAYGEPKLTITKAVLPPVDLGAGSTVPYTVVLNNASGTSPARGLHLKDIVPTGMQDATPTLTSVEVFDPSTATSSTLPAGRFTPSYAGGLWFLDVVPGHGTEVPAGGRMAFNFTSSVDASAAAGTSLTNTMWADYATQDDSSTARAYTPISASANVVLPSPITVSKAGTPANLTIGDVASYTVSVRVPAYQIAYWPAIVDNLPIGGAEYVPGSAVLAKVSGTPVTGAAFQAGSTPVTSSPTATSTRLTWQLADFIDNRGQATDYVFSLSFKVKITGVDHSGAKEFWPMPANASVPFTDVARTDWNTTYVAAPGSPNKSTANVTATTTVKQPWLTVTKVITNGASFGGSSPVSFTVTATNANNWQAEHLSFTDYLPVGMRSTTPTVSAVRIGGVLQAPASYTVQPYDSATGLLSIAFPDGTKVNPSSTLAVDLVGTTDATPLAGSSMVNTASVGFNTQADGSGRSFPATSAVAANTGTAAVAVASPTSVKSIVSSTTAGIGDVVTYRIRTTVPAHTQAKNVTLVDVVQNQGMAFLAGSAAFTGVSGSPAVPAALNPITQVANSGLTTTFTVDSALGDRIIDNSNSATDYVFDITYKMSVTALNGATWVWFAKGATATSNNKITLNWTANTGAKTTPGSNIPLTVKWPNLTVTKTSDVPTAAAGQTVNYTVKVKNDGTFPAYAALSGPSLVDTLPSGIDTSTVTLNTVQASWPATHTLATPASYSWAVVGSRLQVTYAQPADTSTVVPVGGTLTFSYSAKLRSDVGAGTQLTNTAAAFWSSEPSAAPYARTYDGTNANQPTGWKSSVTVGVPNLGLVKAFASSGATTYTIGQEVPYTITAAIPLNTTAYNTVVTDYIPSGLTVRAVSVSGGSGTLMVGGKSPVDGRTLITWSPGDVLNPSTAKLTLFATATVDSTYSPSGGAVSAGQSIVNTAAVTWKTQASGGTSVTTTSNPVPLTVVEPAITISKSLATPITPGKAWAGQTVTYTVDAVNGVINASPAYGITLSDLIPANLFRPAENSPKLVSVTLNGVPLNEFTDYVQNFSANPVTVVTSNLLPIPPGADLRVVYTTTLPPAPATTEGAAWTNTVTGSGWRSLPGAGRIYGPASKTATLTTQAPVLAIAKLVTSDTWLQWGRVASYKATLTNTGSAPVSTVTFTDQLSSADMVLVPGSTQAIWPTGSSNPTELWNPITQTLTWSGIPATLAAGESMTLTWSATVQNSAPVGTQDDTITATASDPASGTVTSPGAHAFVTITNPKVTAAKTLHAGQNPFVPLGATVTYDLGVLNSGNTTMTTIPMKDTFDSSKLQFVSASVAPDSQAPTGTLTWNNRAGAGVAPGARTATVTVTFKALATATSLTDTVTVGGAIDSHLSTAATSTATESSLAITNPHVRLTKLLQGPALVPVGSAVTYRLLLENDGDTTLTALPLADTFNSANLGFTTATVAPGSTLPAGHLTWPNALSAPLAPGQSTSIDVTFNALATGVAVSNAASSVAGIDEHGGVVPTATASDNSLTIGRPVLAIAKAASVATAEAGQGVTYTVDVTNGGTTPAYNLNLADAVPADLFAAGTSPVLQTVTLDGTPVSSGYVFDNGSDPVTFIADNTLSIPAGSTLQLSYLVHVNGGTVNGASETNSATVTGYESLPFGGVKWSGPSATSTIQVVAPVLVTTKTVTGRSVIQPGDTTTYRLSTTNIGAATARDMQFYDVFLDPHMSLVGLGTYTRPDGSTLDVPPLALPFGVAFMTLETLEPGQTATLDWSMTAASDTPASDQPDFGLTAGADGAGTVSPSNLATASVKVTIPHLTVSKSLVGPALVAVGAPVAYDITIENDGTSAVATLPVTDVYDAARLAPVDQLPPADVATGGTLSWDNALQLTTPLLPGESLTLRANFSALATGTSVADTVTVAGVKDTDGSPVPSVGATNNELTIGRPEMTLTKSASVTTAWAGQTVTYTVEAQNTGNTTAYGVHIQDLIGATVWPPAFVSAKLDGVDIPAGDVDISSNPVTVRADVPAGQKLVLVLTVQAPSGVPDGTWLPNTAQIPSYTSLPNGGGESYPKVTAESGFTLLAPTLEATKTVIGDTHPVPGDVVNYQVTVTNTGNAPATDVEMRDVLSDNDLSLAAAGVITWPDGSTANVGGSQAGGVLDLGPALGTLQPGESATLRWGMKVDASATSGTKTDTATISSTDPAGSKISAPRSSAAVEVTHPSIGVHKVLLTPANGHASIGTAATYGITVTNNGDTTLTTVPLADAYDTTRLLYNSASLPPDSQTLGNLGWTNILAVGDTLAPGATTDTITVTFTAEATGTATNVATVSGAVDVWGHSPADAVATNNQLTVTHPHVVVAKRLNNAIPAIPLGHEATYTIVVTNDGDTPLTSVPLADTYDASRLEFVSAVPGETSVGGGVINWASLASTATPLMPGDSTSVTLAFKVIATGTLVDTATVAGARDTWGGIAPDTSATDRTGTGTHPEVSVDKQLATGQNLPVMVGNNVTYTFRVTNTGDTTLAAVSLTDAYLPQQLAYVSAEPTPSATPPGSVVWSDVTQGHGLVPGQSTTATATFRVLVAASSLNDTATVGGLDTDGNRTLASHSTNTAAGSYDDGTLTIVKTSSPASGTIVDSGQTIRYTLDYVNSSPTTVTGSSVVDKLVSALSFVPDSISLNGVPVPDSAGWNAAANTVSVALPPVSAGATGSVSFSARVGPWNDSRGGILNSAMWADSVGSALGTASPTLHNVDPLDITKSVRDVSGKGKVRSGDVLEWTIRVTNRGVVPATNVRVTDTVPAGTTYVKGSIAGPGADASGNPHLAWNVGTLATGQSVTLTFRSAISKSIKNGTKISNQALVTADQSRPKKSSATGGTVNDPTTIVVRTSGNEMWTLLLVALMMGLALGLALPRWGRRKGLLLAVSGLLAASALVAGGLELAAAAGYDVPAPSDVVTALTAQPATSSTMSLTKAGSTTTSADNSVRIPKIKLTVPLLEGKDMGVLNHGLWHQPPSVAPGERGNCVIAGHRISYEFAKLNKLSRGDKVYVSWGGRTHVYRVDSVSTRNAGSATLKFRVGSTEKLVLYTCTPRWKGDKRTVVTCSPIN